MVDQEWLGLAVVRALSEPAVAMLEPYVRRHDLNGGIEVIREGDAAGSLFLLARGHAEAVRKDSLAPLGTLDAPTVFGEMALIAGTTRLAGVRTTSPCTLFEIPRDAVFAAAQQDPKLPQALLEFHHERLWRNVLAVSPIFSALGERRGRQLAGAFRPVTHGPGAVLLTEGAPGSGLFIVLRGRCQVVRGAQLVAELAEGDLFGEISLALFDRPCTASVRTVGEAILLQLSRADFQQLVMSDPETRTRIMQLALGRLNALGKKSDVRKPAIY